MLHFSSRIGYTFSCQLHFRLHFRLHFFVAQIVAIVAQWQPCTKQKFSQNDLNPLWLIWTKRIHIKISAFVLKSLYVKCGLNAFGFYLPSKLKKNKQKLLLKYLQINVK